MHSSFRYTFVSCAALVCSTLAFAPTAIFAEAAKKRTPWTASRILGQPTPPPPFRAAPVFPKLTFVNPTVLTNAPGTDRLFVVELRGRIYSFPNQRSVAAAELAIDLREAIPEMRQAYGLTFHPDFARNRICYVCYVLDANLEEGTRVSQFRVSKTDPPTFIADSEKILLTWRSGGHNGGCLKFGPDGYLYITTGDAGPAFPPDPLKSGQDVSNLLSSILRIDVDRTHGENAYSIPSDNPFVKLEGARGEVWAYGFRNPWKMSFDFATGQLWVGDVGWELWEMIYRVEKGGNYGWSLVEGRQPVHKERPRGPSPILEPTAEHSHTESRSITGGFVYRGNRLRDLIGRYIYGDYVTGKLWSLQQKKGEPAEIREIADTGLPIICFGVDNANELYLVSYEGRIFRLEPIVAADSQADFPRRLSETGLFRSAADHSFAEGVVPFQIIAEMWQDGAKAERFVAAPGTEAIGRWNQTVIAKGQLKNAWRLPENSVLGKTISMSTAAGWRRIETQILHLHDGQWFPYTYVWNDSQTDAELLEGPGRTVLLDPPDSDPEGAVRTYRIAGQSECLLCHTTRSGAVQAFHLGQLDRDVRVDGNIVNQVDLLQSLGFFSERPRLPQSSRRYVSPYDESTELEARARTYLHVNCAHCHRRGGGGTASMDVVHDKATDKTNLLGERPTQGTFGIHDARVVAESDPYRSILIYRLAKVGRGRMPYFGSSQIDKQGLRMMHDWIKSLPIAEDSEPAVRTERRKRTADVLAKLQTNDQETELRELISELLATTEGTLRLAMALHEGRIRSRGRDEALRQAAALEDPARRDLLEPFLPESERRKRLGETIDPEAILNLSGNAERGRKLFVESQLQCRNCHRIGDIGKPLGPDLSALGGTQSKPQLLDSMIYPSKKIDPKYATYLVETVNGKVFTGLLLEKNERGVSLRDAANQVVKIARADIELSTPLRTSLMPDLQLRDLTANEVADLLEFLAQQKNGPQPEIQ